MEHDWSYQEGPDPRQCRNCFGTDEKQRCVPRPKGRQATDGRRCIGCPATRPDFVVLPAGQLARVCVECAQAKSYWVHAGTHDEPIELHATLDRAVLGVEGIVQRGHLTPVWVWDVATQCEVARALEPDELAICRKLGLAYGFDDDDETKHQYRHLCWPGFQTTALCKGTRLWFHGPIGETSRPIVDCEECLGQWSAVLRTVRATGTDALWIVTELTEVVGRLAAQHAKLFATFSAASDLLWALENPADAKEVPDCDPAKLRSRLAAALNDVPAAPESPLRQRQLERAVSELLGTLPMCARCKDGPRQIATHRSLDAAGDGMYTCDEHSRPGGFDDSGPFPLKWMAAVRRAKLLLEGS